MATSLYLTATAATLADTEQLVQFFATLGERGPGTAGRDQVAVAVRQGFAENFESQAAGDSGAWAALAPSTIKDRIRRGFPGPRPILVRRGDYRSSFTLHEAPDHVAEFETRPGLWLWREGSGDYRVGWLESGTEKMPPRPVLELGRRAENRIEITLQQVLDHLGPAE